MDSENMSTKEEMAKSEDFEELPPLPMMPKIAPNFNNISPVLPPLPVIHIPLPPLPSPQVQLPLPQLVVPPQVVAPKIENKEDSLGNAMDLLVTQKIVAEIPNVSDLESKKIDDDDLSWD